MAAGRVILGVDSETNVAISLEPLADGSFLLGVSDGPRGEATSQFHCHAEDLADVALGREITIAGTAGVLSIHPAGDRVVIDYSDLGGKSCSTCTVSMASFGRLLRVVRNRAYAS